MKHIQTVAIIGAGSLGVMYGQQLTSRLGSGDVFFIADQPRIQRYTREGIYCNGQQCDFRYQDQDHPAGKADLIIFAVKFTAIDAAVEAAAGFADENTIFLSILNGIESEARIAQRFGAEHLLYCVVHGMDTVKNGNHLRYHNRGTVVFGDCDNRATEDVEAVADLMERAEMTYQIPENITQKMWSKLMFNAGINPAAAVFDIGYGGMQDAGPARKIIIDTMKEAQAVAACEQVLLADEEIDQWLQILDSLNPGGMPSMRQDILAHRKTEVELFSGTIRTLGQKHGVATPLNDYFYAEIKRLENSQTGSHK